MLGAYLASLEVIWVVLGGLGGQWLFLPDRRAHLASVKEIWVILGSLGGAWAVESIWSLYVDSA